MASKKKAESKKAISKWYVEELQSGAKTFYSAAQKDGDQVILKGGYWDTRKEAEHLVAKLNEEEGVDECLR